MLDICDVPIIGETSDGASPDFSDVRRSVTFLVKADTPDLLQIRRHSSTSLTRYLLLTAVVAGPTCSTHPQVYHTHTTIEPASVRLRLVVISDVSF